MKQNLKTAIHQQVPLNGAMLSFNSPAVAESLAFSGLDFVIIDCEHAPIGPSALPGLIRAVEFASAYPIVRVPEISRSAFQWALDGGAAGLLVPQVRTEDDVRRALRYALYPPMGERGLGPGRASRYGLTLADYQAQANSRVAILIQIETREALENFEHMQNLPGVDLFFIGPGDLSQALGVPGEITHPKVTEAIDGIVERGRKGTVPFGILALDEDSIRRWWTRGIRFLVTGSDSLFLMRAGSQAADLFRKIVAEHESGRPAPR